MSMSAMEKAHFSSLIRELTERVERLEKNASQPEAKRGPGRPPKENKVDGTPTAD